MVAIKNVVLAASAVASALAAPATTKRQDWFGGSGMGAWGGQGQSQGQGQGQSWGQAWGQGGQGQQGQGQATGASTGAAGASTGAASSSGEADHVPTTGDQSGAAAPSTGASTGDQSGAAAPSTGASTGASAGGNASDSSAATAGSTGAAGTTSLAAVSGETITDNNSGQSGSYYFSHWHESAGATMTLGDGSYSLEWTEASGNVVSGIGWNPASAKTVTYQADIQASGNWYLSLYGWTKSPLIEFYVVEAFGSYDPSSAASAVGTAEIDGSTYTLLQTTRTNQPSIEGTSTFQQYWAVRSEHRTSGSIDFGAHIDAWKGAGLDLGSFDYMILATEGYKSSGSSTVTVS